MREKKGRMVLLCVLLVTGLVAAGIASALGVGNLLDGKRVETLTLPEEETQVDEWLVIAKKDPRVLELIEGKEYKIAGSGYLKIGGKEIGTLMLEIERKCYEVAIDLENEVVISIEEQEFKWLSLVEMAKKDPRVQEIIEGKEWEVEFVNLMGFSSTSRGSSSYASLMFKVEDERYFVNVDTDNQMVTSVDLIDHQGWLEIAKKDPRVQELIEGKEQKIIWYNPLCIWGQTVGALTLEINGKQYSISVNLGDEKVLISEYEPTELVEHREPIEIAKEDPRVQGLIEGKEYRIHDLHYLSTSIRSEYAVMTLEIEGKYYRVTIDQINEVVESIEGLELEWLEYAKKDPRVQELIEGKWYEIAGSTYYEVGADKIALLILEIKGEYYHIAVDLLKGTVISIEKLDLEWLIWLEMAKKDSRVQELLEGKEYEVCWSHLYEFMGKEIAALVLEVDGKCYEIAIDPNDETVISIEEGEPAWLSFVEIAKKDPRVQEIIDGKEYEVCGSGRYELMGKEIGTLMLEVGGKCYEIVIDLENEIVTSIEERELKWSVFIDIAEKDPRVQEIISGRAVNWEFMPYSLALGQGVSLTLEVGEESYSVNIDTDRQVVTSIDLIDPVGWLELAKKDSLVQEIIEGKEYKIVLHHLSSFEGETHASLRLEVEGKLYRIGVHLADGEVEVFEVVVEEHEYPDPFEIAKKDPMVKGLIEGKEYRTTGSSSGGHSMSMTGSPGQLGRVIERTSPIAGVTLEVDGKYYAITVDLETEEVMSIVNLGLEWLRMVRLDREVRELLEGKEYKLVGSTYYPIGIGGESVVTLMLEVEGEYYRITIDNLYDEGIVIDVEAWSGGAPIN